MKGYGVFGFMVDALVVDLVGSSGDSSSDMFVGGMSFYPLKRHGAG